MAKSNKKTFIIVLFLVLIVALGVGYAAFSDTLTISGTANANGSFDLEFTSAEVASSAGVKTTGTGDVTGATISSDKNTLTVKVVDLSYPGAGAQFHTVITNVGSVPAKILSVTPTNITGNNNAIKITGLDAITTSHQTIQPNGTCTLDFTVEWDSNVTELTSADSDFSFSLVMNYEQDTTAFTGTAGHNDVNP